MENTKRQSSDISNQGLAQLEISGQFQRSGSVSSTDKFSQIHLEQPKKCSSPRTLTAQPNSQEHSPADSAMQFLERRRSNDSSTVNQRRHSYYNQIQPDLYRRRGSIISIASSLSSTQSNSPTTATNFGGNGNSVDRNRSSRTVSVMAGRAQLQLNYDFSKSDFIVQLVEASIQLSSIQLEECQLWFSLGSADNNCEAKKRCGKVRQVDKDGKLVACSEKFKFAMSYDELLQQTLLMELVSIKNRAGSPPTFVHHAKTSVALSLLNPSDDELLIWVDLESVRENENPCGELNLCLQYLPSAARFTLTIHQATNLPARMDGHPNAYVRASLIQDDKIILKKRKTNVKKATVTPSWNEVLTFSVDQNLIKRCRLEVCVMDCDRFGNSSRPIGRVNFSTIKQHLPSCGIGNISAVHLWREVIQGRNVVIPQWLPLEPITATSTLSINMS